MRRERKGPGGVGSRIRLVRMAIFWPLSSLPSSPTSTRQRTSHRNSIFKPQDQVLWLDMVYMSGLAIVLPALQATCHRCQINIPTIHYHCLQCDDFDICLNCSAKGIYCCNDAHEWVKRTINYRDVVVLGDKLTPMMTRTLQNTALNTYPTLFEPPNPSDTPQKLFENEHRCIRKTNPREILFYTDGGCSRNGQSNPQGGCAFVFRPSAYTEDGELSFAGTIGFALEAQGPTGLAIKHTSNRAELRAVIGALQFRDWSSDCNAGWRSIVVATDSEYVAKGATDWAKVWEVDRWTKIDLDSQTRVAVKNQDLWKLLLREVRILHGKGVNVSFWAIPRALNERADKIAKQVTRGGRHQEYRMVTPNGPVDSRSIPWQCE